MAASIPSTSHPDVLLIGAGIMSTTRVRAETAAILNINNMAEIAQ